MLKYHFLSSGMELLWVTLLGRSDGRLDGLSDGRDGLSDGWSDGQLDGLSDIIGIGQSLLCTCACSII
jgi:hypothetical protein